MSSKRWFALVIAGVLFLVSLAFQAMSNVVFKDIESILEEESKFEEILVEKGNNEGKIVILDVNGTIQDIPESPFFSDPLTYNHRNFIAMLDHAAADPYVEGILIRVNSPGGGVVESDEIYNRIQDIKEQYEKPIYVSMGSMAASGGYYIAAPADKIFAHSSTITGSLGVIMQSINVAELADKLGVKAETLTSGQHKDIMSSFREMTPEDRAILQSIIDDAYEDFVNVIATGRNMTKEEVRAIADGRIYSGKQALELNLIDNLGSYENALEVLIDDIGLGQLDVIQYEPYLSFESLFKLSAQKVIMGQDDVLGIKQFLNQSNSPSLMYLYTDSR